MTEAGQGKGPGVPASLRGRWKEAGETSENKSKGRREPGAGGTHRPQVKRVPWWGRWGRMGPGECSRANAHWRASGGPLPGEEGMLGELEQVEEALEDLMFCKHSLAIFLPGICRHSIKA